MSSKKVLAPLLVCLCLSLMSFKGLNRKNHAKKKARSNKEMVQKRFCYLKATMKNIDGDTYVYSEVIAFDAHTATSNKISMLMEFEDELNSVYSNSVIEVGFEDVVGEFTTKRDAVKSRREAIRQMHQNKRLNRDELKTELLKKGQTVRF